MKCPDVLVDFSALMTQLVHVEATLKYVCQELGENSPEISISLINSKFCFQESKRMRRSKGTEIESCYLLPLGKTSWPSKVDMTKEDKCTTMDIEMQPQRGPPIPKMSPKDCAHPDFIQRYITHLCPRKLEKGMCKNCKNSLKEKF